jgi:hypothetical protein
MTTGIILAFLLAALVLLDIAAWVKAPDSRDNMQSDEWELRRLWRTMR